MSKKGIVLLCALTHFSSSSGMFVRMGPEEFEFMRAFFTQLVEKMPCCKKRSYSPLKEAKGGEDGITKDPYFCELMHPSRQGFPSEEQ